MKKLFLICLVLAAAILFAGCGGDEGKEKGVELQIMTGGVTPYTIVRSDLSSEAVAKTAISVRKMLEACGAEPGITTDWEKNPVSEFEIVIGDTTRSAEAGIDVRALGPDGYIIKPVGTRLFLIGGSDAATQAAADAFLTEFFGGTDPDALTSAPADLVIPAGYEHTYRPDYAVDAITVGGNPLGGYTIVVPAKADQPLAEMLQGYLYENCGIWLDIAEEGTAGSRVLLTDAKAAEKDGFEAVVEDGDLVLRSAAAGGLKRGLHSFIGEVLRTASGTLAFDAGYRYAKPMGGVVTYEEFGAFGDGVHDDFPAISAAHDFANQHGLPVRAKEGATYYIGKHTTTAVIQTNVDWTGAKFIIDDTKMSVNERTHQTFRVQRADTKGIDLKTLGITTLSENQEKLPLTGKLPGACYVMVTDTATKNYIRKGANQNDGSSQTDCFLVSADGTVDPTTPIIWDFKQISTITAYPLETETITIRGGTITTIANQAESKYTYYTTGIEIARSNVVVDGLTHYVEGELDHGAPYDGIIQVNRCANVVIENCLFTPHKTYRTIGSAGTGVSMGSYDLRSNRAINVTWRNCRQTIDIMDTRYWGIFVSDYGKNLTLENCEFSRFDAHMGVTNATIRGCTLGHQGLNAIGHGLLTIENTTIYKPSFISLRGDYGATWKGDVVIRNCVWNPNRGAASNDASYLVSGNCYVDHDYGYVCYMPQNITIDGLKLEEPASGKGNPVYLFSNMDKKWTSEAYEAAMAYPYQRTKTVSIRGFTSSLGKELQVSPNTFMFRNVVITEK